MKRIYLFGLALVAYAGAYGQMSENFDSRTVGEYMGVVSPDWTTWSGTVGGAEDVAVSDVMPESGANSIYFSTVSATGGPQDVVVPFGGELKTGTFVFESDFYIEDNKGAYFNFQGETTIGAMYSMNCQMLHEGTLLMDAGASPLITTTYPPETWFTLTVMINLNTNDWELYIDGVIQGRFSNASASNQVASADLYPVNNATNGGNNQAGYYMDNVSYEHTPYTLPALNLGATQIINTKGLASTNVSPSVVVRNLGTSNITSFDVSLEYDGTTINETVTGVSISSLDYYTVDFADVLALISGENDMTATISNVNGGGADDDADDDIKVESLSPLVPAPGKVVLGEEATGTWCGWCPRGAVFMDQMADDYPEHFIGVAVHNGDPMTVDDYDAAIGDFISGYPSMLVDRGGDIDPSAVEASFLDRIVIAPKAVLTVGSDYVDGATSMKVSVTADFDEAIAGNYRLALIIVEDGVTGTASGYNQANYYSGGGSGVMGGYELLSDPVPAADMVYDHVARAILPSFAGMLGSFPATVEAGESHTVSFDVEIDPDWNLDEVHLVGILIATDAQIDNAGFASMDEAVDNGYVGLEDDLIVTSSINLYPNPTSTHTNIDLGNVDNENVMVQVYNMNGKLVSSRDYGMLNGSYTLPVELSDFEKGMYTVRINKGNTTEIVKLVVE
ncbi:MAG: Omp28-related outer membrane protein [Crocinitomix sp.]|nr:Omp28-related outer membrane protein [Crocinitomix sp.]